VARSEVEFGARAILAAVLQASGTGPQFQLPVSVN
jgi:hypothetical protein